MYALSAMTRARKLFVAAFFIGCYAVLLGNFGRWVWAQL